MDERKIGYIGLGNMGGGMAAHLVASGYAVGVYDLWAEAAQALVDKGATAAGSPREGGGVVRNHHIVAAHAAQCGGCGYGREWHRGGDWRGQDLH